METAISKVLAEEVTNIAVAPSTEALLSEILSTVRDVSNRLENLENSQNLSSQEDPFYFARPKGYRQPNNLFSQVNRNPTFINPYKLPTDPDVDPSVDVQALDDLKEAIAILKRFKQNPKPPQKDGESTE